MTLKQRIVARIETEGPIAFEIYQAMCLYDPDDGFFAAADDVRSSYGGDFLTSPELTAHFGRAVGRFVDDEMKLLPGDTQLVEVAAGSGSLLSALLEETRHRDAYAVERSAVARDALSGTLDGRRVVGDLDQLPSASHRITIANELIDNIPVALVVRTDDGWVEQLVGWSGTDFGFVYETPRDAVREWADRHAGTIEVGSQAEVQIEAAQWLQHLIEDTESGTAIIFDYGGTTEELATRRTSGTLRTYRGHHLGPHPFDEPGKSDITVDVDFSALQLAAVDVGATCELIRQDDFLTEWGLRDVVSRFRRDELEAARAGDVMLQMRLRSERLDVETVLHPRGLGDFRVLIVRWGGR